MQKKPEMRPYRRKYHSSWRTRREKGLISRVKQYLAPFVYYTKLLWELEPPFPLTAKVFITVMTWFLLVLPLCYFLVPPFAALFLINIPWSGTTPIYFAKEGCGCRSTGTSGVNL